jgi:WD40 repeat protein
MFRGHTGEVEALAFSPDGKTAASGSRDKTIRLWDLETGKEIRRFEGHSAYVRAVAFSSDGKRLVSGSGDRNVARLDPDADNDCSVRVWEVETGKQLAELSGHSIEACSVAFSPDGMLVASGGADRICLLWDVTTGRAVAKTQEQTGRIETICFSPDGQLIVTGADNGEIVVWDKELKRLRKVGDGTGKVSSLVFSPDGRTLASGHDDVLIEKRMHGFAEETRMTFRDCGVRVWEVGTWNLAHEFKWDSFGPGAIAFAPAGDRLAARLGRDIKVLDIVNGREVAAFRLQQGGAESAIQFRENAIRALNASFRNICFYNVSITQK